MRKRLSKNVPKKSKVNRPIKNIATRKKITHKTNVRLARKMRRTPTFRTKTSYMRYFINSSRDKHEKNYLKYLRFFSCNFPHSEYKDIIHRGNCRKKKL